MFNEYEIVELRRDIPSENLARGMRGTIVLVYEADPPAYEVEFCDGLRTLALLTLRQEDLERVVIAPGWATP